MMQWDAGPCFWNFGRGIAVMTASRRATCRRCAPPGPPLLTRTCAHSTVTLAGARLRAVTRSGRRAQRFAPAASIVGRRHRSTDEFPGEPTFHLQNTGRPTDDTRRPVVDWTLELVMIPVTDIDRAKAFYEERAGFHVDVDHRAGEDFRVVQMTPPGSGCSIAIMKNIDMAPGTQHGLHLCVSDIEAAQAELVGARRRRRRAVPLRGPGTAARAGSGTTRATARTCRSRIPTGTPGWSRRSDARRRSHDRRGR